LLGVGTHSVRTPLYDCRVEFRKIT